jgi:RNA polymerase sigma-70 factor (ECF subfamily)
MRLAASATTPACVPDDATRTYAQDRETRMRRVVHEQHAFVYRLLRRLGVPERDAEDAQQQVFWTYVRNLDRVEDGKDRSFLFGVALRVAKAARRGSARVLVGPDDAVGRVPSPGVGADEVLDDRRARARLDRLLDAMPFELRTVLVLHEIEEWTMRDIAAALELPPGTVASRLRRARELLKELAKTSDGTRGAR